MSAGYAVENEPVRPAYPFRCDTCGREGTHDDGIACVGDECPDETCSGTITSTSGPTIIRRSDDHDAPFLLNLSVLASSELYATAAEAERFAAWWDEMVGGGSDLAEQIRQAVGR